MLETLKINVVFDDNMEQYQAQIEGFDYAIAYEECKYTAMLHCIEILRDIEESELSNIKS